MPFYLSPSVNVIEQDFSTTVPAVATSVGATVGNFQWGPVDERVTVASENDLINSFGLPTSTTYKDWFTAANFLAYANNLKVVRVVNSAVAKNAGDAAAAYVENEDHFNSNIATIEATANKFVAKYPGAYGNRIGVSYSDADNFAAWGYKDEFDYTPDAEEFFLVVTLDGEIVEKFALSARQGVKDGNNKNIYAPTVVNRESKYVWLIAANLISETVPGTIDPITSAHTTLGSGVDAEGGDAEYMLGWDNFDNAEEVDINFCMQGGASSAVGQYILDNVATSRKDCVAFISPQEVDVVNSADPVTNMISTRDSFSASSYGFMDGNYKYQFDKYNDTYRWVPLNGDMAGISGRTDEIADPWWSPGGFNRGQVKNVVKLAFTPSKAERDEMYKKSINPVLKFPGEGFILFGDKTMQIKPSAFDRINVRRLFIVLEKAIATAAKYQLFEFNDEFTRNRFVQMVTPFLRDVQGRRGITAFEVVADERVNTGEVIDRNEFKAQIAVQPNKSINFIELKFTATKTGVDFEEFIS